MNEMMKPIPLSIFQLHFLQLELLASRPEFYPRVNNATQLNTSRGVGFDVSSISEFNLALRLDIGSGSTLGYRCDHPKSQDVADPTESHLRYTHHNSEPELFIVVLTNSSDLSAACACQL